MALSDTAPSYEGFWRAAIRETGPLDSGIVAYPHIATHLVQPVAGHDSRDQTTPSSPSSAPRPTFWQDPAAAMRQGHTEPQAWQWYYYDPTRWRPLSSQPHPTPVVTAMPGPPILPVSFPAGTASPTTLSVNPSTDVALDPISASLKTLQSQFTTFQEDLDSLQSDVKDALSRLHTLRTTQNKTDRSVKELQNVVGVSATGTRPKGRAKGGRARGRSAPDTIAEPSLEVGDTEFGSVSEKTLVQSVASIQSAVEALLRASQSHLPVIHREAVLPPPPLQSANYFPEGSTRTIESSLPSVANPSQQNLTLQETHSPSVISAVESPSSLSSIAIPAPESAISPEPTLPENEHPHVSTQVRLPSSAPASPLSASSHGLAPGFTPVDCADTANFEQSAGDNAQPNAAEPSAQFPRDDYLSSAPNAVTDTSTRTTSALPSYPTEHIVDNSSSQPAQPTILPTVLSSFDNSVVPSPGGITPIVATPSSSSRILDQSSVLQTSTFITEVVKSSRESELAVDSQALLICTSDSPSSVCDPATPVSGALGSKEPTGSPVQPPVVLDPEDAQMTPDTEGDAILASHTSKAAIPEHHRQLPLIDADDEGLTPGLPTPPSEAVVNERELRMVSRTTHGHIAVRDPDQLPHAYLSATFPVIPTPPFLTPEPPTGEGLGMMSGTRSGGAFGMVFELPSPLTPSLPSPILEAGSSLVENRASHESEQIPTHDITGERTNFSGNTSTAVADTDEVDEGVSNDAPTNETKSGPRTDQAVSAFEMPILTLTNESRSLALSDGDASQIPRISRLPGSPVDRSNSALAESDPNFGVRDVDATYSPIMNGNGYDFHFSSPLRRLSPSVSATPSRYVTPSEPSDSRPTGDHDEDEVWNTLIPDGSGVSTPLSPMLLSHQPSRASSVHPSSLSSQPLSIDPSVLHLHGPGLQLGHLRQFSGVGSLSSLTSLSDTDVDRDRESSRTTSVLAPRADVDRAVGESGSIGRAASEASVGLDGSLAKGGASARVIGGPSASVEELAVLARRAPLKICLKILGRGVKRKRDDVDDSEGGRCLGVETVREDVSTVDRHGGSVDKDTRAGQEDGGFPEVVPPVQIGATTGQGIRTPALNASGLAPKSPIGRLLAVDAIEHPDAPIPRKRKKKHSEKSVGEVHSPRTISKSSKKPPPPRRGVMASYLPTPRKRTKKESERRQTKPQQLPKPPEKYHVRNGQIVAGASERGPRSQAPVVPSALQLEEANQDAQTPTRTRHRKRKDNRAIKTELSSPKNPNRSSSHSARLVKPSPSKEDVRNMISSIGTWPELPGVFSNWDVQFIQCDNCDRWYHYGCVAVGSEDPRLEPGVLFICPTCNHQTPRRQALRNLGDTCGRPDCPEPQVTPDSGIFVIEKLVGRKKCEGYVYMWLAKWEGYPMSQATWIPKENIVGDAARICNTFLEDAVEEGADPSRDMILLREALEGGWGVDLV